MVASRGCVFNIDVSSNWQSLAEEKTRTRVRIRITRVQTRVRHVPNGTSKTGDER